MMTWRTATEAATTHTQTVCTLTSSIFQTIFFLWREGGYEQKTEVKCHFCSIPYGFSDFSRS